MAGLVALQGCGSSGSSSSGDAQIRLVNATHNHASIDLIANPSSVTPASSNKQINSVTVQGASGYVTLGAGAYTMQVTDVGSLSAIATTSPTLTKDVQYSLVAYESNGAVKTTFITESDAAPASGASIVRIYNAAPDAGAVDVYITDPTVDLAHVGSPSLTLSGSSPIQVSSALTFVPGNYRVRVTASGNVNDIRLDIASVALADQQSQVVVLTPTAGGGLVDGAVLVERGSYSAFANTDARVRLVSGTSGGIVVASVGADVIESGAQSPAIGSYVTVPAGSAAWNITVNGNTTAVPPITLAAGTDSTVLVTGSSVASVATQLVDDNHAPATPSAVSLRLVDGLSNSTAGLSLSVDFALLANNVVPGTSSGYKSVASNSSMRLEVDSPLSSAPVSLLTGLNIPAGGTYTVFVIGDGASPAVTVRRDR
jgi:Domain of unknown function (DUF4397)